MSITVHMVKLLVRLSPSVSFWTFSSPCLLGLLKQQLTASDKKRTSIHQSKMKLKGRDTFIMGGHKGLQFNQGNGINATTFANVYGWHLFFTHLIKLDQEQVQHNLQMSVSVTTAPDKMSRRLIVNWHHCGKRKSHGVQQWTSNCFAIGNEWS